jgi:hypothetical protein
MCLCLPLSSACSKAPNQLFNNIHCSLTTYLSIPQPPKTLAAAFSYPASLKLPSPPQRSMAAFHPFLRLPFQLRTLIWELAVEPRTVEVRVKREHGESGKVLHVTSPTPVPAILQTCHEARNLGLYQQAFNFTSGVEPRYVWVNFKVDMISIGDTKFDKIEPAEQRLIRRLRFALENDQSFFHYQSHELGRFSNLEEIHVICEDGLLAWHEAWKYVHWPCKENLRFIDKTTGQMAVCEDLRRKMDEWLASNIFA